MAAQALHGCLEINLSFYYMTVLILKEVQDNDVENGFFEFYPAAVRIIPNGQSRAWVFARPFAFVALAPMPILA